MMFVFKKRVLLIFIILYVCSTSLIANPVSGSFDGNETWCPDCHSRGQLGFYNVFLGPAGAFGYSWSGELSEAKTIRTGLLGAKDYGIWGFYNEEGYTNPKSFGYLGGSDYGAYGSHFSNNYGYLGSNWYGVFGSHSSGNYGYIGSRWQGVSGYFSNGNGGTLGLKYWGGYAYNQVSGSKAFLACERYGAEFHGPTGSSTYVHLASGGTAVYANGGVASWDESGDYAGVLGGPISGVIGLEPDPYGDHGDYAGLFIGDVAIAGHLWVNNAGNKHDVVKLDDGTWAAMTSVESPDAEYIISGKAKLVDGKVRVEFEQPFPQVISEETPVKVLITPEGSWSGIYVTDVSVKGFTAVSEAGDANASFSYMAIGRVKGKEAKPDSKGITEMMQNMPSTIEKLELNMKELDEEREEMLKVEKEHLQEIEKIEAEHKQMEARHAEEMKKMEETDRELRLQMEKMEKEKERSTPE